MKTLAETVKETMQINGLSRPKIYKFSDEHRPVVKGILGEDYSLTYRPISCRSDQDGYQAVLNNIKNDEDSVIWQGIDVKRLPKVIECAKVHASMTSESSPGLSYVLAAAIAVSTFFLGFGVGNMINRDSPQSKHLTTLHKTV